MVGRITELRSKRSQGTQHTTAAKASEEGTEAGGEGEQPAAVESPIEWLRINAKQYAAQILQTVKLRAFNPRAVEWQRMHAIAAVFHLQHGHLDPTDKTKHAELISWLTRQRHLNGMEPSPCRSNQSRTVGGNPLSNTLSEDVLVADVQV